MFSRRDKNGQTEAVMLFQKLSFKTVTFLTSNILDSLHEVYGEFLISSYSGIFSWKTLSWTYSSIRDYSNEYWFCIVSSGNQMTQESFPPSWTPAQIMRLSLNQFKVFCFGSRNQRPWVVNVFSFADPAVVFVRDDLVERYSLLLSIVSLPAYYPLGRLYSLKGSFNLLVDSLVSFCRWSLLLFLAFPIYLPIYKRCRTNTRWRVTYTFYLK